MQGCARLEPCAAGITSSADFIFMTADTAEPERGVAQGSCSALAIERPSETTSNFEPTSISDSHNEISRNFLRTLETTLRT